jgi:hypothetical protein
VVCYLPYFMQQLITHPLLALLPFCCLFTYSTYGNQLLALLPFSSVHSATLPPLLCAIFQFFFLHGEGQSAQGPMLVYPRDGWGNAA